MARGILYYFILLFGFFSLLVQAGESEIEKQQLKHIEESSAFDLFQSFRQPKKVAFSAIMGGSSHSHWVLSILDELHKRGHETTFITKSDQTKFSKNYPHIKAVSIGDTYIENLDDVMRALRAKPQIDAAVEFVELMGAPFKEDFISIENLIKENNYDVIICDAFNTACVEAAYKNNIPFVITSSLPQGPDATAPYINNEMYTMNVPTTQFMGFWDRINDKFIKPVKFLWQLRNYLPIKRNTYKSLGIQDSSSPMAKWHNAVKMFNTAFGFQQGRPIGPMVELVGPIVKHHIPQMSSDLQDYFATHNSIAYIAFGQHAVMTESDVQLIITGLLESYENEEIDGIVWATRGLEKTFPDYIVTQSNTTYGVKGFFDYNNQSDIMFISWAPQMAILNHPSTSLFISHGGSASLYESLYSGVRMVIFPFFGDQPQASITAEKNGYGLQLSYQSSQEEATRIIRKVAKDEDGKFQKNANRFQALVQIRSKHGVIKGADLVEEVLFLNEDGKITHRKDVKDDMSFIKANNIDLYTFVISVVLSVAYTSIRLFIYTFQAFSSRSANNMIKQKTL